MAEVARKSLSHPRFYRKPKPITKILSANNKSLLQIGEYDISARLLEYSIKNEPIEVFTQGRKLSMNGPDYSITSRLFLENEDEAKHLLGDIVSGVKMIMKDTILYGGIVTSYSIDEKRNGLQPQTVFTLEFSHHKKF